MKFFYLFLTFLLISCQNNHDTNEVKAITDEEIVNIIIRDYVDSNYPCRLPPPPKEGFTNYDSLEIEFRKNSICTLCFGSRPTIEIEKLTSLNYNINLESCSDTEDMHLKIWKIFRCDCSTEVFVYFSVTKRYSYTFEVECVFTGKEYTSEVIYSAVH